MSSPALEMRERLRAEGLFVGFDQVGFAPAAPPRNAEAYRHWLENGWHGEMAYMAREDAVRRRLDPAEALPGCRSIIVASLRYGDSPAEDAGPTPASRAPLVARYARGRDYHLVFEELLGQLSARIAVLAPESTCKPYVDYGPVMERDHAQRAGLGWIGKNTMLINPRLGSYLLLGELLTTLDLPPDEPFTADRCGTCRRCIDACPTGAIVEPERAVDARLCISYLTIELRGSIPHELRPLIGNRVFGCDICQEVCPWNDDQRTSPEAGPPAAGPAAPPAGRPWAIASMLQWAEELLGMDEEEYRQRYRDTALTRPRRDGMLRNLCVGLGNSGDPGARETLDRCARDGSPLVREHATWALERLDG